MQSQSQRTCAFTGWSIFPFFELKGHQIHFACFGNSSTTSCNDLSWLTWVSPTYCTLSSSTAETLEFGKETSGRTNGQFDLSSSEWRLFKAIIMRYSAVCKIPTARSRAVLKYSHGNDDISQATPVVFFRNERRK